MKPARQSASFSRIIAAAAASSLLVVLLAYLSWDAAGDRGLSTSSQETASALQQTRPLDAARTGLPNRPAGQLLPGALSVATEAPAGPAFRLLERLPQPVIAEVLPPGEPVPSAVLDVTSSTLIDPASTASLALLQKGDPVSFPAPEGGWIPGQVTYRETETGTGRLSIAGQLAGRPGHQFSIFIKEGVVSATLLLPDERRAFLVQQAEDGRLLLQEKPIQSVICHGMPVDPNQEPRPQGASQEGPLANTTVPLLDSRPAATEVLYLDFDGEVVTDPHWGGGNTIIALPALLNGVLISPAQITEVWEMVSEDFRPFNVSITTDVNRYNNAPVGKRMRCIVTPTKTAAPQAGGVAYLDSFSKAGSTFSTNIPCWSFNDNNTRTMAMTISHELGHTLGLDHDGRIPFDGAPYEEYYGGHGAGPTAWGPLMGAPFGRPLTQWSRGEYFRGNRPEDDLALIARPANTFGYVADDVGNTSGLAKTVGGNLFGIIDESGLIHKDDDVDCFRFTTGGGMLNVTCSPNPTEPNLNTRLELRDNSGTLLAESSPNNVLTSSISQNLPVGEYFLMVKSQGEGDPVNNPPTGFTSYGSIGRYQLSGSFAGLPAEATILAQPESADVDEDKPVTFRVSTLSNSTVKYQWVKIVGGVETDIPGAKSATYKIGKAKVSHIASYKVRCINNTGVVESDTVTLDVFLKPRILGQPPNGVVAAGGNLTIAPAYQGSPPLVFRWFKNNQLIPDEESGTLEIADVAWSDAGAYKLEISNRLGKAVSRAAAVKIDSPPVFLSMPDLFAVPNGGSAKLAAQIAGSPPFTFAWFKDDVLIEGAKASSLKLLGNPGTPGQYKLRVTNAFGEITSDETAVVVDDRLAITQQPFAGGPYAKDDSATLTVETTGSEPKTYQWQLNRKDIPGATSQILELNPLTWFQNGRYRVIVRNRVSMVVSKETPLAVSSPPEITMQPQSLKGARRGSITFVVAAAGTRKLTYQWRKDGVEIPKATSSKLKFTKLDDPHQGSYDVIVTNPLGSITSDAATLIVEDRPVIVTHPQKSFAITGGVIAANVAADGSPELLYQWQRNKRDIPGQTTDTLSLPANVPADSGTYRVIVTNDVGTAISKGAAIKVMIPPSIVTHPVDVTIYEGQAATFTVKAAGTGPFKYRWFRDGVQISTAAKLKLTNVRLDKAGNYTVTVSNNAASVDSNAAVLDVVPVPEPAITLMVPTETKVNSKIALLGDNLGFTRSVAIGGKSAGFVTTVSGEVIATVPQGSTGGAVRATSYGGIANAPQNLVVSHLATNDMFAHAKILTGESANESANSDAFTMEPFEPWHADTFVSKSAWWRWTAPKTGTYEMSSKFSGNDTVIAVYLGEALTMLTPIAYDDGYNGDGFSNWWGEVKINAIKGVSYRIAIAKWAGFVGDPDRHRLRISPAKASSAPLASLTETSAGITLPPAQTSEPALDGSEYAAAATDEAAGSGASQEELLHDEFSQETTLGGGEPGNQNAVQLWRPAMPEEITDASLITTSFTARIEQPGNGISQDTFSWTLYNHAEDPLLALVFNARDGAIQVVNAAGQTWACDPVLIPGSSHRFEIVTNLAAGTWDMRIDGVTQFEGLPLDLGGAPANLLDVVAAWNRQDSAHPAALVFSGFQVWTETTDEE